jgi:16S rRNA (cytidine1402-2'-O)-methyltransferase
MPSKPRSKTASHDKSSQKPDGPGETRPPQDPIISIPPTSAGEHGPHRGSGKGGRSSLFRPRAVDQHLEQGHGSNGRATGTLHVVATPIGNLADISLRALEVLRAVDWIAAEDTRHTRKLLSHYDIHRPLVSYHMHNARQREEDLLERLDMGQSGALVSDAGTPGISDPGALLIQAALDRGIPLEVLPGPAAFLMALVASGLPTYPFAFVGFPPARGTRRKQFFQLHGSLPMTVVLYEAPHRLQSTLTDVLHAWGDRRVAVARELTKLYEEIFRGSISQALEHFSGGARGEVTVVVAPLETSDVRVAAEQDTGFDWRCELVELLGQPEQTVKTASEQVAGRHHLSRRLVYQQALRIRSSHR